MEDRDRDRAWLMKHVPVGFVLGSGPQEDDLPDSGPDDPLISGSVISDPAISETVIIHYSRSGMRGMNAFLIAFLVAWTLGFSYVLIDYLADSALEGGSSLPLWFVLFFLAIEIYVVVVAVYFFFCQKSFRLGLERIVIETRIWGFRWSKSIPKRSIIRLDQVRDGGVGEDSFPSWGLIVESDQRTKLIRRQPHEKSLWLGQVLANWAGVPFEGLPLDRTPSDLDPDGLP